MTPLEYTGPWARPLPESVFKACTSDAPSVVEYFHLIGYEVKTA